MKNDDAVVADAIQVVNAVCIRRDGAMLLVLLRDKETDRCAWILPGGKVNPDELFRNALVRELQEELPGAGFVLAKNPLRKSFFGQTPFSKKRIQVTLYQAVLRKGVERMQPGSEIKDFLWVFPDDLIRILDDIADIDYDTHAYGDRLYLNSGLLCDHDGSTHVISAVTLDILKRLLYRGEFRLDC